MDYYAKRRMQRGTDIAMTRALSPHLSKAQIREQLAEAARNTAALQTNSAPAPSEFQPGKTKGISVRLSRFDLREGREPGADAPSDNGASPCD